MSKFIALLPDELAAEELTKKLGDLQIDDLDWSIVNEANHDRILPAFAWPGTTSGGTTGTPAAPVVISDNDNSATLEDEGVDESDADYFGRAVAHGGTAIVIDTPDDRDSDVHAALKNGSATRIVKE